MMKKHNGEVSLNKLWYEWLRMPSPTDKAYYDAKHPFHVLEMEIAHREFTVRALVRNTLENPRLEDMDDIEKITGFYAYINWMARSIKAGNISDYYVEYSSMTIEILCRCRKEISSKHYPNLGSPEDV